ncbi:MAG: hypothetical protein ACJ8C4_02705 [Gemmataceae bacterium]
MDLDLPFWFKQRQAKAEEIGPGTYKVTGPNLNPGVVTIRMDDNQRWLAVLKADADGPDIATTELTFPSPREAMSAAFEMYRTHMIIG